MKKHDYVIKKYIWFTNPKTKRIEQKILKEQVYTTWLGLFIKKIIYSFLYKVVIYEEEQ